MTLTLLLSFVFFLELCAHWHSRAETLEKHNPSDLLCTCNQIAATIDGASQVFFPPTPEYSFDISHAFSSSSEASACSVEPGSAEGLSKILRMLGSTRTPFAVKGGGHASNPKFSSTSGVQIALSRFNETKVNITSGTVEVGAGLTWDQVYVALEPTGVNVVGGRIPGVGVAGLTLGGGYSYKSSQYGLSLDNVVRYELVLPNGTVKSVSSKDDDLWFGLRGGFNNFGIVTKFTLKSHPQTTVWVGVQERFTDHIGDLFETWQGGILTYAENQLDEIKEALVEFQQKNDTKAACVVSLIYSSGQLSVVISFFYDAPTPSGVFDDFLAIPAIGGNVTTRSFSDLILSASSPGASSSLRNFLDNMPVTQYSSVVFDAFVNQTRFWGAPLWALDKNSSLSSGFEPFDKSLFSHGSASAYPPDRSHAIFPTGVKLVWSDASLDDKMAFVLRNISDTVRDVALADGQKVSHAAKYPNYALFGTPLEDMYGGNVERLRKIRAAIDQEDVMGLTGGWKF
ncbi:FAD-binding domain-containing protein [Russula emetica]|nr:FAD-binding domain-containing protein [Russula emetica]